MRVGLREMEGVSSPWQYNELQQQEGYAMQPLDFGRHVSTWASDVQEDFWQDVKPALLRLVKELMEGTMEGIRDNLVQVAWHQPAPQARTDARNGYFTRSWTTDLGVITDLRVPRTRRHAITTRVLQPFTASRSPLYEAIRGLFLAGVSTRRVGECVRPFLGRSYSASFISQLTKTLDSHVRAFHQRPLHDHYLYLFFDGIVLKGKDALGAKKRVILTAYGLKADGRREIIGFVVDRSESQAAWERLLYDLVNRGLVGHATRLIVTDGCPGLHAALDTVYPRIPRQRCWVHKLRNIAGKLRKSIQEACLAQAKGIYQAQTRRQAVKRFHCWAARWRSEAPKAVACLEADLDELLSFLDCPNIHHRMIRTTNTIERVFREVRRRTRPMSCFTNDASIERILYALFSYFNDRWQRRKPLPMVPPAPPPMAMAA